MILTFVHQTLVLPSSRDRMISRLASSKQSQSARRFCLRISCKTDERIESLESIAINAGLPLFEKSLSRLNISHINRRNPTTLQINIGLTCNLACRHCHVDSSPARTETMGIDVANRLLYLAENSSSIKTVDITGGAPELHDQFRTLVKLFRAADLQVIDRCNLTVLFQKGQEDLPSFLAQNKVKIVASMPCYSPENVNKQRGNGVFDKSILALQKLNSLGYGQDNSDLEIDLVYNPVGPNLPPEQNALEKAYKKVLLDEFGIRFNKLYCITNMPIKRFATDLQEKDKLEPYLNLLVSNFNPATVESVMCLNMVHVAWDGSIYDCDFNYALDLELPPNTVTNPILPRLSNRLNVFDIESFDELVEKRIRTGMHCYGCCAGSGSSCGGALE